MQILINTVFLFRILYNVSVRKFTWIKELKIEKEETYIFMQFFNNVCRNDYFCVSSITASGA